MAPTSRVTMAIAIALALAAVVGLLARAVGPETTADLATHQPAPPSTPAPPSAPAPALSVRTIGSRRELDVARSTFRGQWPLVVETATIACSPRESASTKLMAATVVINGREFRLNGMALGFPELGALWLDSPTNPGAKVSISDLVKASLELCPQI